MKALSVRAPWWWAILHLGKDIENRDWATTRRGTIYLHAGKWWQEYEVKSDLLDVWYIRCHPTTEQGITALGWNTQQVRAAGGCIVGKVDIVDCVTQSKSPWFFGKYGFVLANPVAFPEPVPCKGALGFFEVPDLAIQSKAVR